MKSSSLVNDGCLPGDVSSSNSVFRVGHGFEELPTEKEKQIRIRSNCCSSFSFRITDVTLH